MQPEPVWLKFAAQSLSGIAVEVYKDLRGLIWRLGKSQRDKIDAACHNYAQKYVERHGWIKVFSVGMREPIPLESVYTAVHILDQDSLKRYQSTKDMEAAYRESGRRQFQFAATKRRQGIKIANDEQFLMILGGPGTGKSTFLRKIGLEALKGKRGDFKHRCIPVFIELKEFTEEKVNVEETIVEEFRIYGHPNPEAMTEAALKKGKLLVLFDGLDEVPTKNTDAVIEQIRSLVDKYSDNRFIASCRIAAYRGGFPLGRAIN